jgi:hypothetical protein
MKLEAIIYGPEFTTEEGNTTEQKNNETHKENNV